MHKILAISIFSPQKPHEFDFLHKEFINIFYQSVLVILHNSMDFCNQHFRFYKKMLLKLHFFNKQSDDYIEINRYKNFS